MKMHLECLPCVVRQGLDAARMITRDQNIQEKIMRDVLKLLAENPFTQSPAHRGYEIHKKIREISGNKDPYKEIKERHNKIALSLAPELREKMCFSPDPFETAVRLAIAGNIIDMGMSSAVSRAQIIDSIDRVLEYPIPHERFVKLKKRAAEAESILYLADNAGEIVFDRLLIEELPTERVVLVVKAGPVINDAVYQDAEFAGLAQMVKVVDNGSNAPGTCLDYVSDEFMKRFNSADLIIAKGQANFESLNDCDRPVVFLFQAKCNVVAKMAGTEVGSVVIRFQDELDATLQKNRN